LIRAAASQPDAARVFALVIRLGLAMFGAVVLAGRRVVFWQHRDAGE